MKSCKKYGDYHDRMYVFDRCQIEAAGILSFSFSSSIGFSVFHQDNHIHIKYENDILNE